MIVKLSNKEIVLKEITAEDLSFLLLLYASTRENEMQRVPHWTIEMKNEFVASQFQAQHVYYQQNYIGADFWVILKGKEKVGRLYVQENYKNEGIRIIDISLLPQFRNQGLGERILKDLIEEAKSRKVALSIHVESFNPAKRLYERLGFKKISETNGVYHLMEWKNLA